MSLSHNALACYRRVATWRGIAYSIGMHPGMRFTQSPHPFVLVMTCPFSCKHTSTRLTHYGVFMLSVPSQVPKADVWL